MPTYQFKCKECGHITEVVQSMKDTTSTYECEMCNRDADKFIGAVNFHLKGLGWTVPEHKKFDMKNGRKRSADDYKQTRMEREEEKDLNKGT